MVPKFSDGQLEPSARIQCCFFASELARRQSKSEKGNPINESQCQNQNPPVSKSSAYDNRHNRRPDLMGPWFAKGSLSEKPIIRHSLLVISRRYERGRGVAAAPRLPAASMATG
jgi:hypothetical protein